MYFTESMYQQKWQVGKSGLSEQSNKLENQATWKYFHAVYATAPYIHTSPPPLSVDEIGQAFPGLQHTKSRLHVSNRLLDNSKNWTLFQMLMLVYGRV